MANESIIKTINLILAPVVMITSCGLILNGLIARYSWLSDRVRSTYQERLQWEEKEEHPDRVDHLSHLLEDWLSHHHQVHDVLVLVYLAVLIFMVDMGVIALAVLVPMPWISQMVILVFLIGIGILFWAMILIAKELRSSHYSTQWEAAYKCPRCQDSAPSMRRNKISHLKNSHGKFL